MSLKLWPKKKPINKITVRICLKNKRPKRGGRGVVDSWNIEVYALNGRDNIN